MRTFAKVALIVTLALVAAKAKVRNPLSSVFKIKQKYGMWMMHFQASLEGLRSAMDQYYAGMDLELLNKQELEEKMLDYLLETVSIQLDEQSIELSQSDVQMKDGRVDVMWTLKEVPKDVLHADIRIKTCSEVDGYSNVLQFEHGATKHHYVLSDNNNFAVSFQL